MRKVSEYNEVWNENNPNDIIKEGDGYVIHHIDGNPENNDISNLEKMKREDHNTLHHSGRIMPIESKQKLSEERKEKYKNIENHPMFGKSHSDETKQKISEANSGMKNGMYGRKGEDHPNYGTCHSEEIRRKISERTKQAMANPELRKKLSNSRGFSKFKSGGRRK